MKKTILIIAGVLVMITGSVFAQNTPEEKGLEAITLDAIKAQLEFLASDWTEGRETGMKGIRLAGDYVASMFKYEGIEPAGDMGRPNYRRMMRGGPGSRPDRTYFQNFTLLETLPGGSSGLVIKNSGKEYVFQDNVDFTIPRANASASVSGPMIFVGYGIDSDAFDIHDLDGADVKGKIVLRLSGFPGQNDPDSEMNKKFMSDRMAAYRLSRSKNDKLVEMGALAVIDVNPSYDPGNSMGVNADDWNLSPNEGRSNPDFIRLSLDREGPAGLLNVTVTNKVVNSILENSNIDLEKFAEDAARGKKFKPVDLKGVSADISTVVKKRRVNVRNVVAMIEGERTDEIIVVGGHMDHMGMSGGRVWNGADDNASGTVGVMTIAKAFAATGVKPKRTIVFCAWTGEEKGLLGSTYFANNPSFGTTDQIKFYLNYDMISRDAENDTEKVNVDLTFNSNYPELEEMSKRNVEKFGLKMSYNYRGQDHPTGGSDYTAFTNNGIPIIAVMAAMHPEYHTPADHVELVNWDKMLDIIKLGFLNMWEIANSDFNK